MHKTINIGGGQNIKCFLTIFFRFPTDEKLKEMWITAVEIPSDQITETYFTTRLKFATKYIIFQGQ